ncbi:sulfatase [Rapidithrix thailandica]|uniref:Sulfatase n=1 Tax=Rapidithrix thailandica TaxID=413964 RepID=A0AAW9RSX6_9BACT
MIMNLFKPYYASLFLFLFFACQAKKHEQAKPNIILIYVDDYGWRDVGFNGSQFYETPHIDQLAADGMTFTNAYANAPNCAPSRACLLSGQYSPRHGIYTVNSSERGDKAQRKIIPIPNKTTLDTGVLTMAEALKPAGYTSVSIGKWHLGEAPYTGPKGQGFDINIGGTHKGHPKSYFSPYQNPKLQDGPEGEYLTDRLNEEAIRFIEQHQEAPFFMYLTHFAVHTPIQGKKELTEKYNHKPVVDEQKNAEYAAMIESVDQGVGKIVEKLKALNLYQNTMIVFYSDNGGHGVVTSNKPLRGSKGMLYEGGIRVPMSVTWPEKIQARTRSEVPVIGTDLFPSFLEAAGLKKPEEKILDGESLFPLLTQSGPLQREAIYWHFPAYLEAYHPSQGAFRITPAGAIRKGDYKLIEYFEEGRFELFNLKEDLEESQNLIAKEPAKLQELKLLMSQWRQAIQAPVPMEPNPDYIVREDVR